MIRILHVIGGMNSGGAETVIMNLYRSIDRNIMQFDFVVHTNEKCFYDEEINRLGGIIYHTEKFNVKNYFQYCKFWKQFYKDHPEYKIVHGHINSSAAIYLGIANHYDLITIAHSHNTKNKDHSIKALAFKFFSYPIRFIAKYFMACSKQAAIDRFGKRVASSNNCYIMKNGINVDKYSFSQIRRNEIRNQLNLTNELVVGHVGRFTQQKNHSFLIDVFNQIVIKHNNSKLLLIGTGELESEIREKTKELSLTDKVIFLGVTNSVEDYMQAMDVFVFPSLFEGLGMALVEAQVSGLPCIVSSEIQDEAIIDSGIVIKKELNDDISDWANTIIDSFETISRKDKSNEAKKANYDNRDVASWLQNFYLDVYPSDDSRILGED